MKTRDTCTTSDGRFKQTKVAAAVVGLLLHLAPCALAQGTMTIGFEGPAFPGGPTPQPRGRADTITSYYEGGVYFWNPYGLENFVLFGGGIDSYPDDGTAYLAVGSGAKLAMSFNTSPFPTVFGLSSMDLAEYSTAFPGPATLHVVGYGGMGYTVTRDITTDGINDGTGPLQDFQTFTFGPEWARLYRIDILSDKFSLDNIVLTGVPEPSSAVLIALGVAGLLLHWGWRCLAK